MGDSGLIGRKAMPNGDKLFPFDDTQAIREEMGRVMPIYQGIEKLTKEGDQLQWGGPYLFKDGFTAMAHNRAHFTVLDPPDCRPAEGKFYLATRRGNPSNSMTFGTTDPLMGTERRDSIFISAEDAKHLGLQDSAAVDRLFRHRQDERHPSTSRRSSPARCKLIGRKPMF